MEMTSTPFSGHCHASIKRWEKRVEVSWGNVSFLVHPGLSKAGSSLEIQCTLFILLVVFIGCLRSVRPEKMTQYFKALDVINIMQFNTPIAYIRQVLKGWEAKRWSNEKGEYMPIKGKASWSLQSILWAIWKRLHIVSKVPCGRNSPWGWHGPNNLGEYPEP